VRELLCNFGHRGQNWSESVKAARITQELFASKLTTVTARKIGDELSAVRGAFWEMYDVEEVRGKFI